MKRILFLLVLAVMVVLLTACSEDEFYEWIDYLTVSCEKSHGLSIHCNNKATYERNPGYWQGLYITTPEPVAVPNSPLLPPDNQTVTCDPVYKLENGVMLAFDWNCQ